MEAHEILAPALQKYYSALKSLYDFGQQGDFFDDVSNLDKFFSEFRNITFVIQKAVGTEENREIYSQLRTKHRYCSKPCGYLTDTGCETVWVTGV